MLQTLTSRIEYLSATRQQINHTCCPYKRNFVSDTASYIFSSQQDRVKTYDRKTQHMRGKMVSFLIISIVIKS